MKMCADDTPLYDDTPEHEVHCVASSFRLAGILIQINDEHEAHPVMHLSRSATDVISSQLRGGNISTGAPRRAVSNTTC